MFCSFKACKVLFASFFRKCMGTHIHKHTHLQKSHSQLLNSIWIPLCRICYFFFFSSGSSNGSDVVCCGIMTSFFQFCFSWLIWVQMALDLTLRIVGPQCAACGDRPSRVLWRQQIPPVSVASLVLPVRKLLQVSAAVMEGRLWLRCVGQFPCLWGTLRPTSCFLLIHAARLVHSPSEKQHL